MDDHEPRSLGNQNIITYCSILYMAACANTHIQTCMHTDTHTYTYIHTHTITLHYITLHYITLHYITYTHTHTYRHTDRHTHNYRHTYIHPARTHTYMRANVHPSIHPSSHPTIHDPSMIRPYNETPKQCGERWKDLKSSVAASWWDKSDPSSESMVFIQGGLCKKRCQVRLCKFPLWRSL